MPNHSTNQQDCELINAQQTVRAAVKALPNPDLLRQLTLDAEAATARGYYDPVEDERLRDIFARYLGMRSALWDVIDTLGTHFKRFRGRKNRLDEDDIARFAIAYAGAVLIVRTGEYLIDLAVSRDLVWQKLDEAESRYGIPRKRFTRLFRQLTSARQMRPYYAARDYFDRNRDAIMDALATEPLRPIAVILRALNLPDASRGDHLRRYTRFVRFSLRRRGWSGVQALVFDMFESSGSTIADLKVPGIKPFGAPKRMTADQIARIRERLRPGDVIVTRHDDAVSNLFLPGFWPHSALHVGAQTPDGHINMLEAKKDGVLLRAVEDTLQVDACVVLRPTLDQSVIDTAIARGLTHENKLYDFVFDFGTSDRLVCTEVIYRAYHGVGPVRFDLPMKAGRYCLSAEDLLNQGIGQGWFTPLLICNIGGEERWLDGDAAKAALRESFASEF